MGKQLRNRIPKYQVKIQVKKKEPLLPPPQKKQQKTKHKLKHLLSMVTFNVSLDEAIKYLKPLFQTEKKCQFYIQVTIGRRGIVTCFPASRVIAALFMSIIYSKKVKHIVAVTCHIGQARGIRRVSIAHLWLVS